jgi:glycosyltransferase involved in cell wall biosynthesis
MKIGFDAKRAFSNVAGLGNFSRNTINALSRHFPDDRYFLFNPGSTKPIYEAPESSTELKPVGFWWKTFRNTWRSFSITHLAKILELDIYHGLTHELPIGIERTKTKKIVTIHDLIYIRYPEYFKKIDRTIYDRKFRHACKVADRIHAISDQTKRDIMDFYHIPEDKIDVIYQSINPVFYKSIDDNHKQELRKKFQIPERFMLSVGTIESRKNLFSLLEGMISSKVYLPLVVVGKHTKYYHQVQKFIEADLNRLQVIFLPRIKDEELAALYQMAEVMIYPSKFEGFGLPVAEAQASGCPVITSNTSSLPEAGGDAAVYINPDEPNHIGRAIKKVTSDSRLRETMIKKGRINAQRFTPEEYVDKLYKLYNSVLV